MFPFRNNPKITTNWFHDKTGKSVKQKTKRAYYGMDIVEGKGKKPALLKIHFQEEKKRLGGSGELERHWRSWLEFELDTRFARDLKMILNERVVEEEEDGS